MADFNEIIVKSAAEWAQDNPVLAEGQLGIESDVRNGVQTGTVQGKMGDGVSRWASLSYWQPTSLATITGDISTLQGETSTINTQLDAVTNAAEGSLFYADGAGNLVEFEGGAVIASDMTGIFLAGSIMPNVNLSGATGMTAVFARNLTGVYWPGVNLAGATLTGGLNFTNANLTGAHLTGGADATGATFTDANLTGADLTAGVLANAVMIRTRLVSGNLTGANVTGVDLTDANLTSAILTGADLTGALCEGTILTGATMPAAADTKAEFKALVGAWNAVTTIWTDGNPLG